MTTWFSRVPLAAPIAVLLSLVIASTATAVTWNAKVTLNSSGTAFAHGLVTLSSTNAVALFDAGPHLYTRRTLDSGSSWSSKVRLTDLNVGLGLWADISGRDNMVDVAFDETNSTTGVTRLRYRKSNNSGSSFAAAITLRSVSGDDSMSPGVGRGPGGVVAVAWHELISNTIRVRVSTDNGLSFGSETTLATVTGSWMHPPAVAVGDGVIYVAYHVNATDIRLRRSLNNGASWLSAVTMGNNGTESPSIDTMTATAVGERAFIGFTVHEGTQSWTRYKRTNNSGGTWSAQLDISPPSANPGLSPELTLQGSNLYAVYEQCVMANCNGTKVMYRTKTLSGAWSAPVQASHSGPAWASPAGVGRATKILVLYAADNGETSPYEPNSDVYVRPGTP